MDEKSLTGSDVLADLDGKLEDQENDNLDTIENRTTIIKQVTKKMSVKGRCRVLTIVSSLIEDLGVDDSPLLKPENQN